MASKKPRKPAKRRARTPASAVRLVPPPAELLPIVGVGASAGGLEALEQFLRNAPVDSGLAYVIVQHLDPTQPGIMPELLQRATKMKVAQVKDRTKVQRDCVYVIPPNRDLSLLRGALYLLEPASPRGLRLPIDSFFRSLAEDQRASCVGVILSGMGTDGTLGLRAIKEQGGLAAVQEPSDAKFDSMPRSALDTGLVDVAAKASELPGKILAILRHGPRAAPADQPLGAKTQNGLEKVMILLRSSSGHDFSQYKKSTLYRRIERRMGVHQVDSIANYVRLLQESQQERELLFNEFLIGVTSFFRDPEAWDSLRDRALPALLAERPRGGQLRAWVTGCSTGEEAYSLAITFKEALEKVKPKVSYLLQIFATDLDRSAIDKARAGVYSANIAADVSPERLKRWFTKEPNGSWRVVKEIRDMVILAVQDVIRDPPFTRVDLLICRNLLIYLERDLQAQLLALFHYSLSPGGLLFLGSSETVGALTRMFLSANTKHRLYFRKATSDRLDLTSFPASALPVRIAAPPELDTKRPAPDLSGLVDELVLREHGPSAALISDNGDVLCISGRTGRYLEPATGKANMNLLAMARDGIRHELTRAVRRAVRSEKPVVLRGLRVGSEGRPQRVDVTVQPLQEPQAFRGTLLVVFAEVPAAWLVAQSDTRPPAKGTSAQVELREVRRDLRTVTDELQTAREEMQSSQEELKSGNEEMQSLNEELQSTNEELTTSKEEMQSMNEELQTVNGELQAKLDELSRSNNDMRNLLDSMDLATLFLDRGLLIRRYTARATSLFKLIPSDVGRPVTDITTELAYPNLPEELRSVLRTLVFSEKQVSTADGRWFTVRIMPYRTLQDSIDGLVVTLGEITVAKTLEAELRRTRERFAGLLEELPKGATVLDENGSQVPRQSVRARILSAEQAGFSRWRIVADGTPAGVPR